MAKDFNLDFQLEAQVSQIWKYNRVIINSLSFETHEQCDIMTSQLVNGSLVNCAHLLAGCHLWL